MPALVVAGVTIPVAASGVTRDREDGVDRARAFDKTMRATQAGTAKRSWTFATPPVARATADTYEATLATVTAQTCSGDILGGTVTCLTEILPGWTPIKQSTGHLAVVHFALYEQ